MKAAWASLEGHTIGGVFPLIRLLGSSDRSAVFLSSAATRTPSDVVLKLVPAVAGQVESLLARWRAATSLDHPHLLRLFEAGECELGGQRYLYSVMEYAEQNLAQLLEHRVLAPDEVREMLGPILDALAFLHDSKRVQGGLKPSNVLVVGEQLKLACDAIGPASNGVSNGSAGATALSPYLPPEAAGGGRSTAGDIWALGVVTCEALSQRRPAGLHAVGGGIALPADIPPTFSEMISKCLSRKPEDRPDVARLQAWQKGGDLEPASPPEPEATAANVVQAAASPTSTRLVIRAKLISQDEVTEPVELRAHWRPVPLIIAGVALLAIVAGGFYFFSSGKTPAEADTPAAAPRVAAQAPRPQAAASSQAPASQAPVSQTPGSQGSASQAPATNASIPAPAARATASDASSAINEVIPVVPRSASQTIRGTIRVSVRVIVNEDGHVIAATSEDPGPSRYFERLSLDAAKKWTFAPAAAGEKRLMRVKFNYARSGTTAKASPINAESQAK